VFPTPAPSPKEAHPDYGAPTPSPTPSSLHPLNADVFKSSYVCRLYFV
jgi:hypothetical protein